MGGSTPGPWRLDECKMISGANGEDIIDHDTGYGRVIKKSDEAIILSAPEMLAMLEELARMALDRDYGCHICCTEWSHNSEKHRPDCRLIALIKKARNET